MLVDVALFGMVHGVPHDVGDMLVGKPIGNLATTPHPFDKVRTSQHA
jgi:hypothetical protein